jgi:hypothetical protein
MKKLLIVSTISLLFFTGCDQNGNYVSSSYEEEQHCGPAYPANPICPWD